ncbi:MAG TPA: cytochrome c oxidase assembly protein [Candidatus Acidoferrum sp.]|nr:cytochrome c oxidase assembly protein [Candidatus Acidoferrum sp.]
MPLTAQSILDEWSSPVGFDVAIFLTASVYFRGWLALRRLSPGLLVTWRLAVFLGGMLFLWIAIGSPLAAFDDVSLSVHMVQHILLMLVIPPLILLSAPFLPLLHGLPQRFVRKIFGPFLSWTPTQWLGKFLTHPLTCWILAAVALLAWHVPSLFELALRSDAWHEVEHACFLLTSMLFWWPVVQPFPSEARWPRWSVPLYLFLGMLPGSALGAFLTFCDRVLYPSYGAAVSIFGVTPLEDQIFAGALMWVLGFLVCFVPAVFITVNLLSPAAARLGERVPVPAFSRRSVMPERAAPAVPGISRNHV